MADLNVIIVGSGPSLKDIDPQEILRADAHVIAVNGAIDWLNSANSWFTLDPSEENIRRMSNPVDGVVYYAAVDQKSRDKIPPHVRKLQRLSNPPIKTPVVKNSPQYWFRRWGCKEGLAETTNCINTGNSAYGALGLAYHWRPSKILLMGVDGSKHCRITGDGPSKRSLMHLPVLFGTAVEQLKRARIDVVNASPRSAVTCFQRMTPRRGLQWLNK